MGQFFYRLNSYFIRQKWAFFALFLGIILFLIQGIKRLQINEDIFAIFPKKEAFTDYQNLLKESKLNSKVIFSITNHDSITEDHIIVLKNNIQHEGLLTNFVLFPEDKALLFVEQTNRNLPYLFTDEDYQNLSKRINKDAVNATILKIKRQIINGQGFFYQSFLMKDPLSLSAPYLNVFQKDKENGIIAQDGFFTDVNQERLYFFADLNYSITDAQKNAQLTNHLNQLAQKYPFDFFGTFLISNENAQQIRKDNWLVSSLAVASILLLLILYFRSLILPVIFVVPALFGAFGGLGIMGYLHPQISAISLATASVLLGIILDYSFHFFTHLKEHKSILETVKQIANPLIIGSFTTIGAFYALTFTDSQILKDFGRIAIVTLGSAALTTLFFLPVFLEIFKFKFKATKKNTPKEFPLKKIAIRIGLFATLLFTIYTFIFPPELHFDADIQHLGFHSEELIQKEKDFTGIDPISDKKIYLFASSTSLEQALRANLNLFQFLKQRKDSLGISEIVSTATVFPYQNELSEKRLHWQQFWKEKAPLLKSYMSESADAQGLNSNAFDDFYNTLAANYQGDTISLQALQMGAFMHQGENGTHHIITSVLIPKKFVTQLKEEIKSLEHIEVYDVSDLASSLLVSVREDLNFLLYFSAALVFFSFLLIYGRIELAIFAFIPMLLSWLWILAFAELFGIEFNFVNIILATFIFGLGDDFSIFVMDGMLQKLKYGTTLLKSYRTAIWLSAITTILGTGALIFAKHPSIHSIAAISVLGILCVLWATLFLQPFLFDRMVFRRIQKNKYPISAFHLVITLFLYSYFFVGALFLNLILILIQFIPISKFKKQRFFNYLISKLLKSTLFMGGHVKKNVIQFDLIDPHKPCVFVANHTSFLDILLTASLHPKSVLMVKKWVYNSPFFGLFIRYAGYIFAEEGSEEGLVTVAERIKQGYSVVIFPEGTRSADGAMHRFHKGAFFLAQKLKLDIQPLLLHGVYDVIPKNDFLIKRGQLTVKVLPRIQHDSNEYGLTYQERSKKIRAYMQDEMIKLKSELETPDYLFPRIHKNYWFKGPVLEWYVRIKYHLEKKNYAHYDQLIGDRKSILSIGCGYGYFELFLHYRSADREIEAWDFDASKVELAKQIRDKSIALHFEYKDVRGAKIPSKDVYFLLDVLHYLSYEDQFEILQSMVDGMPDHGKIIIRDGLQNHSKKHRNTKFTEFLSIKVFKFNQSSTDLYFLDESLLTDFVNKNQLKMTKIGHSKNTSNTLFILTK